jgi:hypothetical protein
MLNTIMPLESGLVNMGRTTRVQREVCGNRYKAAKSGRESGLRRRTARSGGRPELRYFAEDATLAAAETPAA